MRLTWYAFFGHDLPDASYNSILRQNVSIVRGKRGSFAYRLERIFRTRHLRRFYSVRLAPLRRSNLLFTCSTNRLGYWQNSVGIRVLIRDWYFKCHGCKPVDIYKVGNLAFARPSAIRWTSSFLLNGCRAKCSLKAYLGLISWSSLQMRRASSTSPR